MKLTVAERHLIAQIVNVKLSQATLREHIRLEEIYKAAKPDDAHLPIPQDYIDEKDKELFEKYNGILVNKIEDEEHRKIILEAIKKSNMEREKVWNNEMEPDFDAKLTEDDIQMLKNFYDTDGRSFPKQYHKAILNLYEKLNKAIEKQTKPKKKKK